MKTLIKSSMWLVAAGLLTACASEDTQQKDETKQSETKYVATFTGHQPNSNSSAKSRTTATHTIGNPAQVLWEATDKIWVKADDGNFYQSEAADFSASATPTNHSRANFRLSQGSYMKLNPEIRYTGASTNANTVVIASNQTQNSPNDFSHLKAAGDCGSAFSQGGGNDHEFTLQHRASYLCFLPRCMNTALGPNVKLTRITVTADKDIAGTYDFSNGSLMGKSPTGGSKTITLRLGDTHNFSLNTTTTNIAMNGAYMVIAPGTYTLTINFHIEDNNGTGGDITKTLIGFTCPEGQIKDITANVTPPTMPNYTEYRYYMWDAQQHYWWGHLKPNGSPDGIFPSAASDPRMLHSNPNPYTAQPLAATQSCRNCPNVNEMAWYAFNGDPHWVEAGSMIDNSGHLQTVYRDGIWLKKKAKIMADEGITEAQMKNGYPKYNPVDWRITRPAYSLSAPVIPKTTPVPSTTDYFFVPVLGFYYQGSLIDSSKGYYWTSTADPANSSNSYCLNFDRNSVGVSYLMRGYGFIAIQFE